MFVTKARSRRVCFLGVMMVGGFSLMGCRVFSSQHDDSGADPAPTKPPQNKTDAPAVVAEGEYECASKACKKKTEFCVTQRFTGGGKVAAAECHTVPEGCTEIDCAKESLGEPLSKIGSAAFQSVSEGTLTIEFVTPDLLPLADKVSDKVAAKTLTLTIRSQELLAKISEVVGGGADRTIYVADGAVGYNAEEKTLYCKVIRANGFPTRDLPYTFVNDKFSDKVYIFGYARRMLFLLDATGGQLEPNLGFECLHANDTTPFVVDDLKKIFGDLAEIKS